MAKAQGSHYSWLSKHDLYRAIARYTEDPPERQRLRILVGACPWGRGCTAVFVDYLKGAGERGLADWIRQVSWT